MNQTLDRTMAKKSEREPATASVKVAPSLLLKMQRIVTFRLGRDGKAMKLADYLHDILEPIVNRDYKEAMKLAREESEEVE